MIHCYFGNGKGKTTSAIGLSVRCAGCGNKVLFVQFLKNNDSSEFNVLKDINGIDILYSENYYELYDNLNKDRISTISEAYTKLLFEDAKKKADSYQMIVLDEILDVLEFGYIDEDKLIKLLSEIKEYSEIVLTGHKIKGKIENISDYISEIKEIRHPYSKGILSRKGIEY